MTSARWFFRFALITMSCLFLEASAQAAKPYSGYLGLDILSHGIDRTTQSTNGSLSLFGSMYVNFDSQVFFPLSTDFYFAPRLLWMPDFLLPSRSAGGSAKTSFLIFEIPLVYNYNEAFDVSAGPAVLFYEIKGSGGIEKLGNGNGTTDFAIPGRTQTIRTIGWFLGASYSNNGFRYTLDTATEGLLSSSKRTISLVFTVAYNAFNF
jgi:hypothetical protein